MQQLSDPTYGRAEDGVCEHRWLRPLTQAEPPRLGKCAARGSWVPAGTPGPSHPRGCANKPLASNTLPSYTLVFLCIELEKACLCQPNLVFFLSCTASATGDTLQWWFWHWVQDLKEILSLCFLHALRSVHTGAIPCLTKAECVKETGTIGRKKWPLSRQ